MSQAICAASMAIVPEPQHGSCSAPPSSRGRASRRRRASPRRGFPSAARRLCRSRQPRLNSGSPEVSTYSAARSAPRCSTSCRSGRCVSTLGRSPVASRSASHDRVLDAQRREVQAAATATLRRGVDAQRLRGVIQLAPVDAACQRVEIVLVAVRVFGHLDQHALCEPAFEVESHHVVRVALQRDTAARACTAVPGSSERTSSLEQRLHARRAGQEERTAHAHSVRRKLAGAIFSASRYFATVRRATWMPCSSSIC